MQFYDVIKNETSVKSFTSAPIENAKLDRILNATIASPSWKNGRPYKIVLVDNVFDKEKLANTVMNDTGESANSIKQAPMVAVIVADPAASGHIDNKDYYLVDSAIAMEHFVLAATNEGYGTCWIGCVNENDVKNILSIPENYKVVAMTPVGVTKEKTYSPESFDIGNYVFHNTWNDTYK